MLTNDLANRDPTFSEWNETILRSAIKKIYIHIIDIPI
jgi:hypothetical protein